MKTAVAWPMWMWYRLGLTVTRLLRVRKRCSTLKRAIFIRLRMALICTIATRKTLPSLGKWALKPIVCPLPGLGSSQRDELEPNEAGLQFYEDLFKECHKYGIEPLVTITHFDCPMHLITEYGGWRSRKMLECYERLCRTLFTRYKGLVNYWLTFNEINMILHAPFYGSRSLL